MKTFPVVMGVVSGATIGLNALVFTQVKQTQTEIEQIRKETNEIRKTVEYYRTAERIKVTDKDLQCLAKNIFHEAGIEGHAGKVAVAQVTLNRLKSNRWGKSICDVVYAKAQFSWTLNKKLKWSKPKGELWNQSVAVAREFVYNGKRIKGLENSGFYHTEYIPRPAWATTKVAIQQIGQHIFYKGVRS